MATRWLAALCLIAGCAACTSPTHTVHGGGDVDTFELVNGADTVRVRVADLGGDAYRISTPDDAKVTPTVAVDDKNVIAGLHDAGDGGTGPAVVDVILDDDIHWNVRLAGGATDEAVDLTGGPGGNVDFASGTARATVALPAAGGTQRVVLGGGASQLDVRLGGDAPVRVAATGGAGSVTIDGQAHTGIAGGTVFTPDNWAATTDRYDIDATAGVADLSVTRPARA